MKKSISYITFIQTRKNHDVFYSLITSCIDDNLKLVVFKIDDYEYTIIRGENKKKIGLFSLIYLLLLYVPQSKFIILEEVYRIRCLRALFLKFFDFKTIYIVHNVNRFLYNKTKYRLRFHSLLTLLYSQKEILSREVPYISTYCIPFQLHAKPALLACNVPQPPLTFTLIGDVDQNRKDIFTVLDSFIRILNDGYNIKLQLLGKIKSPEIKNMLIKLNSPNIIYYSEFIPEDKFLIEIARSDFLVLSVNEKFEIDKISYEIYGKTKATGIYYFAMSFGIPTLVNNEYYLDDYLKSLAFTFQNTDELYQLVKRLLIGQLVPDRQRILDSSSKWKKNIFEDLSCFKNFINGEL